MRAQVFRTGTDCGNVLRFFQCRQSTKRERECLHAWIKELDLESSIFHRPPLPDQLIEAVPLHCSQTVVVYIDAVIITRRRAVQLHFEADWLAIVVGSQDEVKIAGVKAEDNLPRGGLKRGAFCTDLPTTAESPLIERESGFWRISTVGILNNRLGGREVFCPMVADVGLR